MENFDKGLVSFQKFDLGFIGNQVSVAIKTYDKEGLNHQEPLENIMGLVAELAFEEWLKSFGGVRGKDYEWNERREDYWNNDPRSWDFRLLKNGLTFEIGAAKPNHHLAVMKDAAHKKESNYFVEVRIIWFNCKIKVLDKWYVINANSYTPLEIKGSEEIKSLEAAQGIIQNDTIGEAQICGFDKVGTIVKQENGWVFSKAGQRETPFSNGFMKELSNLCTRSDLAAIIRRALGLREDNKESEARPYGI